MLRAGQSIPPCAMDHDVMFYVVKGDGEIIVDNESVKLHPGAGIVVPKKAKSREMRAHEDLTVFAVQGR
jgi:quercetin dioxygenase-like cupin family protein